MRARRVRVGRRWTLAPVVVAGLVAALAGACAREADESPVAGADRERREESPAPGSGTEAPQAAAGERPADFEATAQYLDKVGDQSSAQSHRFEISMSMRAVGSGPGERLDIEAAMMSGEQDGARSAMHMDMGEFLQELAAAGGETVPPGLDMTMDAIVDGATLYLRAPLFGAAADAAPPGADLGPIEDLTVLADQWGRVDLNDLGGFSMSELQQTLGGPSGTDPRVLLDVIAGARDVEDLGADDIDGTPVSGLRASLSMEDMLTAQGTDPEAFLGQLGAAPGLDRDAASEQLRALEVPFEVWVDRAGLVRRIAYEMDLSGLGSGVDPGIGAARLQELGYGMRIDFSDYGDPSIAIEPPAGAVDVTEAYHALLRANAAGAAAAGSNPIGS